MKELLKSIGCIAGMVILFITVALGTHWLSSFNVGESFMAYDTLNYCPSMANETKVIIVQRDFDFVTGNITYIVMFGNEQYCVLRDHELENMIRNQTDRNKAKMEKEKKERLIEKFKSK